MIDLKKSILEFNASELSLLRFIGSYCPQEGGVAVHQARGMLSMVEAVDLLDFDCTNRNERFKQEEVSEGTDKMEWELILYPNPTSSIIRIQSNLILEDKTVIEIYNALGQKVKAISINEDIQSIKIDVGLLLDGVYIMHLKNEENTTTKAFIVAK